MNTQTTSDISICKRVSSVMVPLARDKGIIIDNGGHINRGTYRIPQVSIAHAVPRAGHSTQKQPPSKEVAVQVGSVGGGVTITNG